MIETQSGIDEFDRARKDDAVGADNRTLKEAGQLLANCTLFGGLSAEERAAIVASRASACSTPVKRSSPSALPATR